MFVAGDQAYEFEVEIERDPKAVAGLVFYYNSSFYVGEGIGRDVLRRRGRVASHGHSLDVAAHVREVEVVLYESVITAVVEADEGLDACVSEVLELLVEIEPFGLVVAC